MKKFFLLGIIFSMLVVFTGCQGIPGTKQGAENSRETLSKQNTIDTERNYIKYTNERFGFSIEHPGYFGEGEDSVNGDGRSFTSSDGSVSFTVWGARNTSGKTPQSAYENLLKEHSNILFQEQMDDWLEVSWIEGEQIVCEKEIITDSLECGLIIRYPLNQRESSELLISRLTSSFKISQEPDF